MRYSMYYVYVLLLLLYGGSAEEHSDPCTEQINTCACKTAKGYINLDPLDAAKTGGQPKFSGVTDSQSGYSFSYNPCTGFTFAYVDGVAVGKQDYYNYEDAIGLQDGATFTTAAAGTTLVYKYNTVSSNVLLKCDREDEGTLTVTDASSYDEYDLTLKTKYACSDMAPPPPGYSRSGGGLSPGDIMLIIFFVSLAVYFITGVLFNKFYKHSEGLDLIPNVEFWKVLPGLAKDGAVFTWTKITGLLSGSTTKQNEYDSI